MTAAAAGLVASNRFAGGSLGGLLAPVGQPDGGFPFRSRPDLRMPPLNVIVSAPGVAAGLILVAPYDAPPGSQAAR